MSIELHEINYLAVLVAALVAFMVGGLWYGALFGDAWAKAQGWSSDQIEKIKAQMSPAKFFSGMIISYLVLALMFAVLFEAFDVTTPLDGAIIGFLLWLGPSAAVGFTGHLASNRQLAAFLIDQGCQFVYFILMGAIIGWWQ